MCFLCLITLNTHYSKYIDLHLTLELEGRGAFWRTVLFMVLACCSSLCLKETHGHHFVKKKKKKIKVSQAPVSRGSEFVNSGLRFFWMRFDMSDVRHVGSFSIWRKSIVRRLTRQMGKRVLFYGEDEIIHRHLFKSCHVTFKRCLWSNFCSSRVGGGSGGRGGCQTSDRSSRLRFNNRQNECSPSILLQNNRKVKQDPSLCCILPFV